MATTFVKNGSNVLVTSGEDVMSLSGALNIIPDPENPDLIMISAKPDMTNNEDAVRINWTKVTLPVGVVDRNDLITKLSTDFFYKKDGIARDEQDAVLSDEDDLENLGWIQPTLLAGTIKYTTEKGNVRIRQFDLKETSLVKVRRVWLTGTTVGMGIIVYSE